MKAPLVVGYKGEIGSFILQGLLKTMPKALNIYAFDIGETLEECKERIQKADVIFLCVPLEETGNFFKRYQTELQGKTVIEQTTMKSVLFDDIGIKPFLKGINIWSMHILFRPSATPNREDRKVALIRKGASKINPEWETFIGKPWWQIQHEIGKITNSETIFFNDYKEHDKAMALQQTLVHRVLRVLDEVVKVEDCSTYMTQKINGLVKRMDSGNSELYSQIQKSKYADEVTNIFINKLRKIQIGE